MTTIRFTVPGPPVAKERPRRAANGHWYTPGRTHSYERTVATYALAAIAKHGWSRSAETRYALTVRLFLPNARRRDGDNLGKSVADGLIGVVVQDDSQIDEWHIYKAIDAAKPRAEIEVRRLDT